MHNEWNHIIHWVKGQVKKKKKTVSEVLGSIALEEIISMAKEDSERK